uniref:Uncharacterized protein n=1 Tax=Arundo donax TaxID=35708 RepID=A0A0A9SI20_ARUDO
MIILMSISALTLGAEWSLKFKIFLVLAAPSRMLSC